MKIAVSSSDELTRVDLFLSQRLIKFSRTNIQKMISNQSIKINGEWIKKNASLNYGDIINVDVTVIKDGYHGDTSKMYLIGDSKKYSM